MVAHGDRDKRYGGCAAYVGLLEKWNEAAQAVHQGSVAGMRLAHHGNSREILQSRGMQPCNHAFETLHHISTLAFRRANR